jgi:glutamate/tyrosine decarboxylase-like PLP-dependent enzyme
MQPVQQGQYMQKDQQYMQEKMEHASLTCSGMLLHTTSDAHFPGSRPAAPAACLYLLPAARPLQKQQHPTSCT